MTSISGELQTQIMAVLWRIDEGTVEQVRSGLPSRYRGAYTTVQTVLNRLTERGMLKREKAGKGFVYRPAVSESDYIARSIEQTLAGASSQARQAALARLVGGIDSGELSDLQRLARVIDSKRQGRRRT
jgi:predicted transcriptional regulator